MKIIDKFKDYVLSEPRNIQPIIFNPSLLLPVSTQPGETNGPEDENKVDLQQSTEGKEKEAQQQVEEVVEEVAEEAIVPNQVVIQVTQEIDDKEEGFSDPIFINHGVYRIPNSGEFDLNIIFKALFEYRLFLPILTPETQIVSETCCVRDAPITLTYNGILIYTAGGGIAVPTFTIDGIDSDCCCCELPPKPEPNYWFTYTNCDGEAYIDVYIKEVKECCDNEQEIPADAQLAYSSSEYGSEYEDCVQHYRIQFFPGFEPECGCDITSVISNVLHADSIEDFIDPYINGNQFPEDGSDGITYTTHFLDECGVCWTIANIIFEDGGGDDGGGGGFASEYGYDYCNLYLLPLCVQPMEFDSICYYSEEVENEFGAYSYYSEDGYYSYYNSFVRVSDSGSEVVTYQNDFDVNLLFMELNGDSFLVFNVEQSWGLYVDGNGYFDNTTTNLVVDLPDNIDFEESALEQFILCSEEYYDQFFDVLAKYSSIALEDLETNGFVSEETSIFIATLFLQSYAQNITDPFSEPGYGVLEDIQNNVYGLCYDGDINTSPFIVPVFNVPDTYLTDVELCSAEEAEITNIPLEICYCDEGLKERFETWQQEVCDSEYGDPFKYVADNLNAHYVNDGTQAYIEINYVVPQLYTEGCEGYSEAVVESLRICVEGEICNITKLCIDTQALFENYYENGYVDFTNLLYPYTDEPYFSFEDSKGNCYETEYTGDDEGPMYCNLELVECECEVSVNVNIINPNENVSDEGSTVYVNYDESQYSLNFNFIHNNSGTFMEVYFNYYGTVGDNQDSIYVDITGTDLDCCCGIESLILDANDLYEFVASYYNNEEGISLSLNDFLYYFSTEGNLNFLDCDKNCYNFVNTYLGNEQPPEFEVQPCDDESCCESEIIVETIITEIPPEEQVQIAVGQEFDQGCFDQFFDITFVNCNDLTYIDLTWHFNNVYVATDAEEQSDSMSELPTGVDCFNFPIYSSNVLISIPDELEIDCDCPITKIVIPEEALSNYEQYFQDCCTLSETVFYSSGDLLLDQLYCDRALFVQECEDEEINYILDRDENFSYSLIEVGDVIRTTTLTDENDFGVPSNYAFSTYEADLEYAEQNGTGLSLREAIILANQYTDIDSILLQNGTYTFTITDTNEDEGATGDLDIVDTIQLVGGCEGTTIDANDLDRIFDVFDDAGLTLTNLTAQNGAGFSNVGGGAFLHGDNVLTLQNAVIASSIADYGGGVYAGANSTILLKDGSNISGNYAFLYGGGIYALSTDITLNESAISSNNALYYGGAIYGSKVDIILNGNSEVDFNGTSDSGGGLINYNGTVVLNDDSSIHNNTAVYGGGIYSDNTTVTINDNASISANAVSNLGGGLFTVSSTLTLNDFGTVSSNDAFLGGGVYDFNASTINLNDNSSITANTAIVGGGVYTDSLPPTTTINYNGGTISGNTGGDVVPIVLDLNHDGEIQLISAESSQVAWDIDGSGEHQMGWVGPEDGLLVYDKDHDGLVTDISEFMLSSYHPDARTDLEGMLLAFDTNHDHIFDARDEHFDAFGVWQDKNSDGITDDGEFGSLIDWGIESISLDSDHISSMQEGNTIYGSSSYKTIDGESYRVGDVGLSMPALADVVESSNEIADLGPAPQGATVPIAQSDDHVNVPPVVIANNTEEVQVVASCAA